MAFEPIRTERLILRRPVPGDAERLRFASSDLTDGSLHSARCDARDDHPTEEDS